MKRLFLSLLILLANAAWAGPVDDVLDANARGDYVTALRITRPLAVKGEAWAQVILGNSYRVGHGVVQDYAEAAKWYRLAAEQGDAPAQATLGFMYIQGQGLVQDYAEAVKWYRLAAEQEHATAQYNLGVMYAQGQGVAQDYVRAHMWFNLGAVSGNADAVTNRDATANQMTPQQIGEAQKLARECQARKFKGCN